MTLGQKVRYRRTFLGMSQPELSQLTGLTQAYISYIENGERMPTANKLAPLAKALKCTTDYLVYSENKNKDRKAV